jgi:hypothetical protein
VVLRPDGKLRDEFEVVEKGTSSVVRMAEGPNVLEG